MPLHFHMLLWRRVSYVQMCSMFAWERKKTSVPEKEWLRQPQPQVSYNSSLIGAISVLSIILWQMTWKEQRKNFYDTLVNSQRDFFFSDSEHKYFTYSCSFVKQKVLQSESRSVVSNSLWPHGLYSLWNSPGPRILEWVAIPFSRGLPNPGLPHYRRILYQLSHTGSPRILEWVAYPFSSGSS